MKANLNTNSVYMLAVIALLRYNYLKAEILRKI